ncbi:MAG: SdrD B-like domain-containing protein [Gaiellaceae bacterium]
MPILLTMMVGLLFIGTAAAVHDEAFELDGNIDDANPVGGPEVDWDNDIVGVGATGFSTPQTSLPAGFSAATAGPDFTTEIRRGVEVAVTADNTTFTTNSKDIVDISAEWRCVKANNVTDKGDLVNTYAVAYVNAAGELILYFGAEKNDASGTNDLGVWFLQDEDVNCAGGGGGNGNPFVGSHVIGDILVVSEFTGGGTTATVTAYVWDPTDPAAVNNLVQLTTSGICGAPGTDDRLCAITNVSNQVNPPWKTWDKDTGSLDSIDTQQFYEGGINVSAFGLNPCVNKLLTDTRSSVSTTATLYDYALVPFDVCKTKAGVKFNDLDADGMRDAGEPGLPGWTINLYKDTGTIGSYDGEPVFRSDVTDANGAYSFEDILSGSYIVCEVKQANWEQSAPTSAPAGETLVTNCPGSTKGYAFTVGASDLLNNNFGNFQRGAFRILKNSTKGGPVSTAGAIFSYNGSTVTDNGAGDEDPDIGEVCVSGKVPGNYTVTETSAPPGYGTPVNPGPLTVTAVAGTNCTDNLPTGAGVVTFTDPPLADIQVNFRDGGSGETSATSITCTNTGTTADTTPATGWDDSRTHTGIAINPSPRTVVCTIVIDP